MHRRGGDGRDRQQRWTAAVLAPALLAGVVGVAWARSPEPPFQVTATNAAAFRALLPPPVYARVVRGEYRLRVVPVDPERFRHNLSGAFWAASAGNAGRFTVDPATGGLLDRRTGKIPTYVYGFPFPRVDPADPQAGVKILHNYRLQRMQRGGTRHTFTLVDVTLQGEVLRRVEVLLSQEYFLGIPDHGPLPDNTASRQLAAALAPKAVEGVGVLTWRFNDWTTPDRVWAYLPTIRRVRRVRTATRSERVPGFEIRGDDADCFDGKVTAFRWKLVRTAQVLGPLGSHAPYALPLRRAGAGRWELDVPYNPAVYEVPGAAGAGWLPLDTVFVRRPVWVVEGTPKDPYYDSGRIVLYIDRELYHGYYKLAYSRAGELYQTNWCGRAWGRSPDGTVVVPSPLLMLAVNEPENRGTPAGRYTRETFVGRFPQDWFTAKHLAALSGPNSQ